MTFAVSGTKVFMTELLYASYVCVCGGKGKKHGYLVYVCVWREEKETWICVCVWREENETWILGNEFLHIFNFFLAASLLTLAASLLTLKDSS